MPGLNADKIFIVEVSVPVFWPKMRYQPGRYRNSTTVAGLHSGGVGGGFLVRLMRIPFMPLPSLCSWVEGWPHLAITLDGSRSARGKSTFHLILRVADT